MISHISSMAKFTWLAGRNPLKISKTQLKSSSILVNIASVSKVLVNIELPKSAGNNSGDQALCQLGNHLGSHRRQEGEQLPAATASWAALRALGEPVP
eukprot:jgi/Botrbrau1/22615/Bobra.176_1s0045.1